MNPEEQLKADRRYIKNSTNNLIYIINASREASKEGLVEHTRHYNDFLKELLQSQDRITRAEEREMACKAIANLKEPSNVWKLIAMKEIRNPTKYDNQPKQ